MNEPTIPKNSLPLIQQAVYLLYGISITQKFGDKKLSLTEFRKGHFESNN